MASKTKVGDHSFAGDNNYSSGNEVGSGNHFSLVLGNGSGIVVVMLVACMCIAVVVYMATQHGGILAFLVSAVFILGVVVVAGAAIIFIVCKSWLLISNTHTQHKINTQRQWWATQVHQLPSGQVASYDRDTRQLNIHSIRDVQEHRQYAALPQTIESNNDDHMLSFEDLTYRQDGR